MVEDLITVSLLNRSFLLPMKNISEFPEVILVTNGSSCDMLARDFDEDGDVDLILGHDRREPAYSRYFERISASDVVERTGDDNPLNMFNGTVQLIADVDGDGRLEIVLGQKRNAIGTNYLRLFQRAADGSLVEAQENPFRRLPPPEDSGGWSVRCQVHVADWNSHGLPDIFLVLRWKGLGAFMLYLQHVLELGMTLDSHAYEDIDVGPQGQEISVDWNGDDLEDVVVLREVKQGQAKSKQLHLYQHSGERLQEVLGVFENVTGSLPGEGLAAAAAIGDQITASKRRSRAASVLFKTVTVRIVKECKKE
eukprot:s2249_g12.t1